MSDGIDWKARADAAGLTAKRLAFLMGLSEKSASMAIGGYWPGGVPQNMQAVIIAWSLLLPHQRERCLRAADSWNSSDDVRPSIISLATAAPEQLVAHRLVSRAVSIGELVRPATCERCGVGGRIVGHHDDYARPLDVMWLCHHCHVARHDEIGWPVMYRVKRGSGTAARKA